VPPTLLALDTATDMCSVAVMHGERLLERAETVGQRHSERVLPMVDALLAEAGLALADCNAIAFGAGPGAFTGLRIACGIAQGLAFGADRPVVGVGNLEALAFAAREAAPSANRILAVIDARMQEMYWAVYGFDNGNLEEIAAPALAAADELGALAHRYAPDLAAGNALQAFADAAGSVRCATLTEARASAGAIARLAAKRFLQGETVPAALAAPLYVRDRVALTVDERRAVARPAGTR
jgi:tRNA threonylcarbamoyladenosine biosynthesis protein TsaB